MSQVLAEQRRLQQREEARQTILDATEILLVEDGYEAFSIRRLAERSGYAAPTIYHHFGDKLGLINAAVDKCFERLLEKILEVTCGDDAVTNMRAQCHAFIRFGLENPTHYRLLMLPRHDDRPPPASAERARERLAQPLMRLAEDGRLRTPDLNAAQQALWAVLHGVISLRTSRPEYDWSELMAETAIDAMIAGLVAPDRSADAPRSSRRTA